MLEAGEDVVEEARSATGAEIEGSQLEIVILALGVFALVSQLGLLL
jgi:hypothetical protein